MWLGSPRVAGNPIQIAIRQQPLRKRTEGNASHAFSSEQVKQAAFEASLEHGVPWLVNEAGGSQLAQDSQRLRRLLDVVAGDPNVQRLPASNCLVEGRHRLLDRSLRIGPVGVEDVDVIESHALEALVQAGKEVLSRSQSP